MPVSRSQPCRLGDAAQLAPNDIGFEVASCATALALSIGTFIQDMHAQRIRPGRHRLQ
jgi:hypothetical protein